MNPITRFLLVLTALLGVVVGVAVWYSRSLDTPASTAGVPGTVPTTQPSQVALHPDYQAGVEAIQAARFDEARELLEGVPTSDPSYTLALHELGPLYLQLGELERGVEAMTRLCMIEPDNPGLHVNLSVGLFLQERNEEAEYAALRALELDPSHIPARYNLGLYRVAQSKLERAIESYERARQLDSRNAYLQRAVDDLLHLHQRDVEAPAVHYAVAYFANILGHHAQEVDELEHYLELDPVGAVAENARARLADAKLAQQSNARP